MPGMSSCPSSLQFAIQLSEMYKHEAFIAWQLSSSSHHFQKKIIRPKIAHICMRGLPAYHLISFSTATKQTKPVIIRDKNSLHATRMQGIIIMIILWRGEKNCHIRLITNLLRHLHYKLEFVSRWFLLCRNCVYYWHGELTVYKLCELLKEWMAQNSMYKQDDIPKVARFIL